MKAALVEQTLTLTLDPLESGLLQDILKEIIANYQIQPGDLPPRAAAAWYSTRGCESAKMSVEETREWRQTLQQYKSANVQHLTRWRRYLRVPRDGHCQLKLKLEDAPIFLSALNDHRLLRAATQDIAQKEMDVRSLTSFNGLSAAQQTALSEIHFLAWIMEEVLHLLPGNPGGWMEAI